MVCDGVKNIRSLPIMRARSRRSAMPIDWRSSLYIPNSKGSCDGDNAGGHDEECGDFGSVAELFDNG